MDKNHHDISDDEIRIIQSTPDTEQKTESKSKSKRKLTWIYVCAALAILVALVTIFALRSDRVDMYMPAESTPMEKSVADTTPVVTEPVVDVPVGVQPSVEVRDTLVSGVRLTVFTPENATPILIEGNEILGDTSVVLCVQAADIRGDNGGIVGTCVIGGELVSKGEAKGGFCSIVEGNLTIGVADATPLLEEALATGGYFFRQYPLVVSGQVVENKPKGRSIRRALADIDGKMSVVQSAERMTFHDFSQALIDAGARNAIYLVGGVAMGRYKDSDGQHHTIGSPAPWHTPHVNYLVWR